MLKRHFHRRNLPHLYYNEGIYFVTFRLYGSINPNELMKLKDLPQTAEKATAQEQQKTFKRYDSLLDKLQNEIQYLSQPEILEICKSSLHFYDDKEYKLICYCIISNHIHIVFELLSKDRSAGEIIGSVKKFIARESNKILNRKGTFWQSESFDRLIRDDSDLYFIIKYVLMNPISAGLVDTWKDWKGTYCNSQYEVID
jgi:REP element-mobilizing transposase RayT